MGRNMALLTELENDLEYDFYIDSSLPGLGAARRFHRDTGQPG